MTTDAEYRALERLAKATRALLVFMVPAVGEGFSCEGCQRYAEARMAIAHHEHCPVPAASEALSEAQTALYGVRR